MELAGTTWYASACQTQRFVAGIRKAGAMPFVRTWSSDFSSGRHDGGSFVRMAQFDLRLPRRWGAVSGDARVVAAVEPDRLDICEQATLGGGVEGGLEQDRVVAVRPVDRVADRDPVAVRQDRPLPPELASIRWVLAGSLTPTRAFVQGPVQGDIGQVEPDDPVVGAQGNPPFDSDEPAVKAMRTEIQKRKPGTKLALGAVSGWSAAHLLVEGLEAAGQNPTSESFYKAIRRMSDYKTPFGQTVDFTKSPEEKQREGLKRDPNLCGGVLVRGDEKAKKMVQVGEKPTLCLNAVEDAEGEAGQRRIGPGAVIAGRQWTAGSRPRASNVNTASMAETPIRPLRRSVLHEDVARVIREMIVAGEFHGRQKVPVKALAASLAVSTRPLRDAVLLLEAEGWVETVARSGTFVSMVTRTDLEQRLEVLAITVGLAGERACTSPEPSARALEAVIPHLRTASPNPSAWESFVDEVVRCSRSPRLRREYDNAVSSFRSRLAPRSADDVRSALALAEVIVAAVRAGDQAAAEAGCRRLVAATGQALIEEFAERAGGASA